MHYVVNNLPKQYTLAYGDTPFNEPVRYTMIKQLFNKDELREMIDTVEHSNGLEFMNYGIVRNHEGKTFNDSIRNIVAAKQKELSEAIIQASTQEQRVKITDLINDNFYEFWNIHKTKGIYSSVLKGGRSSLKSSVVSLRLVVDQQEDPLANVISFRKVAAYLRTSVYSQVAWAIEMLSCTDDYIFYKSPLMIEHKEHGTGFYFYGVDDPQKIKSTKINKGYVKSIWFEEGAEFKGKEELDTVADTFIRQQIYDHTGKEVPVKQYITYNPPRDPYAWINEWQLEINKDSTWYTHHSTYLEDKKGFLSEQFLHKIRTIEKNDPMYHAWMYLGKVTGYSESIYNYNLFNIVDKIPDDDRIIMTDIAIDSGYSISATTFLFIGLTLKGRIILLDTYYYSPMNQKLKKAPSDFSKDLDEFTTDNQKIYKQPLDTITSDSADGALRNQYLKDYGVYLKPAKKKKKKHMIEYVETLLAEGRVYVLNTERNKIFLEEHKRYRWDPKEGNKEKDDPKVIKEDDHTCDAFQYYVINNLYKLGVK